MDKYITLIKEKISEPLSKMGIVVDDVNFSTENNYKFINIILDKEGGIDMDTICDATNVINPIIDTLSINIEDYILDVSSKERNAN